MARAVWNGSVSFGLVNVPMKAFSAVHDHDVHFHQIDKESGSRIGYEKVAKSTGKPVESGDIELGYEVSKGRYVTFDPDEIADLRPSSTRTLEVTDFVDLASIDPVFFEHTYWLAPANDPAKHAYHLLAAAMEENQRVGIGTVVMRNKQYLSAIRPVDGALAMSTMRFGDEVVPASDIAEVPSRSTKPAKKELALASQIIEALATDWNPKRYHDTYTEELRKLIEAKDRGDEIVAEETTEPQAKVLDLMEALQASVSNARSGKKRGSPKSTARKPTAKKPATSARQAKPKPSTKKSTAKRPHRASA
jgi:DNA end-binding protein Ku